MSASTAARRSAPLCSLVNDVHSRLNPTPVGAIEHPRSIEEAVAAVRRAARSGVPLATCGGRHAMGGQQFASGGRLLDLSGLDRVIGLDTERGTIDVEAGIQWPDLIRACHRLQFGQRSQWGIRQKQTGADRLSIGGAIAANIHGRGLRMRPFVADLESLRLIGPDGELHDCDRARHAGLFRLAVGGYGLFGPVVAARLRLVRRRKLERVVEIRRLESLVEAFDARIREGCLYGDFQFATWPGDEDFLDRGVFSCYRPVADDTPVPAEQLRLSKSAWQRLLALAHCDKRRAFEAFADFYRASSGQIYWSDTHQLSLYLDDYHAALDRELHAELPGSEMITELYVPRSRLVEFMAAAREDFRRNATDLIYGTIRLIERDSETMLAWARESYACVIFNLHVEHRPHAIAEAAAAFRRLIDSAIAAGGSYFPTYHRFAKREQVLACYPQFPAFLRAKLDWDAREVFQSDWYRHYRAMFAA